MKAHVDNLFEKLQKLRAAYSGISNLVRIGYGLKEVAGRSTKIYAFRFYVSEKKSLTQLAKKNRIPAFIDGIPTDVIKIGDIQKLTSVSSAPPVNQNSYRKTGMRGGACIRNEHFENNHPSGFGTLGVLARRESDDQLVGITCSHVANNASDTPQTVDTKVGQPKYWTSCCCCPRGEIGLIKAATLNNDLDCALVEIDEDIEEKVVEHTSENKIEGFPADIVGAALPAPDQIVKKYGQATGLTTGKIIDPAFGNNQMLIELQGGAAGAAFANHGDSGAAIVNDDNQVIGLLVAAWQDPAIAGLVGAQTRPALTKGIATYIKPIMEELGVSIAGVSADEVTLPVLAKPWPGGQADSNLNPEETFASTDFGFTGNVAWDVSGRGPGAVIVETGTQTTNGRSSITVRYDTVSASSAKADAVEIKATKNGDDVKQLRTVVKITPRLNTSNPLDGNNSLRFMAGSGADNQAGVAVSGVAGATQFRAKAEIIYDILPTGAKWDGAGATSFVVGSPGGAAGEIVARREMQFNKGRQNTGDPHRVHTEELNWITAGDSTVTDFQEPTNALPDAIYRLANEGFDPAGMMQAYDRADYRDFLELHNGTAWVQITPRLEWHANLTADLNPAGGAPIAGATNNIGAGATAELIPNEPPVVTFASHHRELKLGQSLTITPVINDPNNDQVTIEWEQIDGPDIGWTDSKRTGADFTFNAPNDDFQFEFKIVGDDGTGGLARTAGNHLSTADEKMTVNVIEWQNWGGGDAVPERNMFEFVDGSLFGIGPEPLNWDVTKGGTNAEIIKADGVDISPPVGQHNGARTIVVRYNNKSSDLTIGETVKIEATNPTRPVGNGRVWFKRRTVFKPTVTVHATDTKTHKIPSTLGARGKDHFCTVKQTGNMVLQVVLDPAPPDNQITWGTQSVRTITSPAVGGDRKTARVGRNPASGLEVPIEIFVDGGQVYDGNSWIIWSIITHTMGTLGPTLFEPDSTNPTYNQMGRDINFICTIQPATIISSTPTTSDIPDLRGDKKDISGTVVHPPDVVGTDTSVMRKGLSLSGGATLKWDISRQIRSNPFDVVSIAPIVSADPLFFTLNSNYPSVHSTHGETVGNDDQWTTDPENNVPYTNGGKLNGYDFPKNGISHSIGSEGDTFENRYHFREFSRLLLDDKWYRISNYFLWKIHIKGKKVSEATDNRDYDGDGNKTDEFWIDNGTTIATNNSNFT